MSPYIYFESNSSKPELYTPDILNPITDVEPFLSFEKSIWNLSPTCNFNRSAKALEMITLFEISLVFKSNSPSVINFSIWDKS